MGKVINIFNFKGGSGKSSVLFNLSTCFLNKGKKVLAIDLDPQANLTSSFLGEKAPLEYHDKNIMSVFERKKELSEVIVHTPCGVDLVPSELEFAFLEMNLIGRETNRASLLKEKLDKVKDNYDIILIDNSPSLAIYTENSFFASDEIILTTVCQYYATMGSIQLLKYIQDKVKTQLNPNLNMCGVVISMFSKRTSSEQDFLALYNKVFGKYMFKTIISTNSNIKNCATHQKTISEFKPKDKGTLEYMALADEILERIGM